MSGILLILGIILKIIGYKVVDSKNRYEFENRQSGGNVTFDNYEKSKAHNRGKLWGGFASHVGNLLIGVAVIVFLVNIVT